MSITLDFDDQALASLPVGPGERERHMQIELACRFYANGWLSIAQGVRLAALDHTHLSWRWPSAASPARSA